MKQLTSEGQNLVKVLAERYHLSPDGVVQMLVAVNNGSGSMAQFYCPELGGGGQWMRGGMTMVGDMFNHGLKATVDSLCNELSNALATMRIFPPLAGSLSGNQWWSADLGSPFSSGSQNDIRYAIFANRLAVEQNGVVSVYDTLDHNIGGVSQQQGGNTSLTFSSQYGTVAVDSLPLVSGQGLPSSPTTNFVEASPTFGQHPSSARESRSAPAGQNVLTSAIDDIVGTIEKLARLRDGGALTDDEFNSKKAELLSRI